jgi:hypothetical protein
MARASGTFETNERNSQVIRSDGQVARAVDIGVSDSAPISLKQTNILSTDNSTTTPLSAGDTFTGTSELNYYNDVMVTVKTDQDGILYMEFSPDGVNWDTSLSFQYKTDRINAPHILVKGPRYYRTRFENTSASAQTFLRLDTSYSHYNKLTSPINGVVSENYDAQNTRPTNYKYEVAGGKRQGRTTWNKFGYNDDVDTTNEELIASFGESINIMTSADTLDIVSTSTQDVSGGTGANLLQITGIDGDFNIVSEFISINGTTPVTTVNSYLGVNRVNVINSGSNLANVGTVTIDDTAGTVGVQAQLPPNGSVTQQCIFHTPINYNFFADWLFINANKTSGGSTPKVTIRGYSYSRVTNTRYEVFRYTIDTSAENTISISPSQPFTIGGREILYFTADTDTNNTSVSVRFSGILERVV